MSAILLANLNDPDRYPLEDNIDVIKDYKWTLSPMLGEHENVPAIILQEFEMDVTHMYAQLIYWWRNATGKNDANPYEGLYVAKPTGILYKFPYYENYHHNITQTWGENAGIQNFGMADILIKAKHFYNMLTGQSYGTYVNKPQVWTNAGLVDYNITFSLFNTGDVDTSNTSAPNTNPLAELSYIKNKRLINRLIMSSLHNQQSALQTTPPALFTVDIPGVRTCKAAVIRNIRVENRGQINRINNENVPDAYEITINIGELIPESRQIFDASIGGGSIVKAIIDDPENQIKKQKAEAEIEKNIENNSIEEAERLMLSR